MCDLWYCVVSNHAAFDVPHCSPGLFGHVTEVKALHIYEGSQVPKHLPIHAVDTNICVAHHVQWAHLRHMKKVAQAECTPAAQDNLEHRAKRASGKMQE